MDGGAPATSGGADERRAAAPDARSSLLSAGVIGIGVMAAVDEIVFHQVLAWHHFYDRLLLSVALLSDGLLHTGELLALVAGFFWLADVRRRRVLIPGVAWGGFFLGAGLFQLFDGIVDHKVLRLHQIRYGVDLLPYDLAWNLAGALLLVVGVAIAWRAWSTGGSRGPTA